MKKITIEFPQGEKLEGMIDIISDDFSFHYSDLGGNGLSGLQCNFQNDSLYYNKLHSLCKVIVAAAKTVVLLNKEQEDERSVATEDAQ